MMRIFYILTLVLFCGALKPEKECHTIWYRSFYAEMKKLEKTSRVTAYGAVQTTTNYSLTVTSINLYPSSTVQYNLVVIAAVVSSTHTISSVTDNQGNSYDIGGYYTHSGYNLYQVYGVQATGGVTTITVTASGTVDLLGAVADEYSGFTSSATNANIYQDRDGGTGTASPLTTPTITPASGSLVVCSEYSNYELLSVGSGYTAYGDGMFSSLGSQYKLSSTTSETPTRGTTTSGWIMISGSYRDPNHQDNNGKSIRSSGSINP